MQYEDTPKREFKGIWIPAEIWENKTLSVNEKVLYLEIDSFTSNNKSCFISNEHIANLLHISENAASKVLNSLVKKGLVIVTKFDGRKRYIQSVTGQTRQKAKADSPNEQVSIGEKDTYYKQDTKPNNDNNTPLTPQGGEQGSLFPDEEEPQKSETKTKKLKKPTVEEVTEYCRKIEFQIDAEDFIDYYDSVGWVVGKTAKPMKDWKAAVRTWKRNRQKNTRINPTNDSDTYEYDRNGNKIKKQDWQ